MTLETRMVNPLDKYKGKGIGNSDEKKNIDVSGIEGLKEIHDTFHRMNGVGELRKMIQAMTQTYDPLTLDAVVQSFPGLMTSPHAKENVGRMITKLVDNSYSAGHNNFILHLENFDEPVKEIGLELAPQRQINMVVYGDVSSFLLTCASNVHLSLYGDLYDYDRAESSLLRANSVILEIMNPNAKINTGEIFSDDAKIIVHEMSQFQKLIRTRLSYNQKYAARGEQRLEGRLTIVYEKNGVERKAEL